MQIVVKLEDSVRQQAVDSFQAIVNDAEGYTRSDETVFESIVTTASLEIPGVKYKGVTGTVTINAPLLKVAAAYLKLRQNITPDTSDEIAAGALFSKFYFFNADDEAEFKKLLSGEKSASFPLYTHNAVKSPSMVVKNRDFVSIGYVQVTDDSVTAAFKAFDYPEENGKCVRGKVIAGVYKFVKDGDKTLATQISCADPCGMVPAGPYNSGLASRNQFLLVLKKVAEGNLNVE